jgi:hypothetical protein
MATMIPANNDAVASDTAKRPTDRITDGHPRLMSLKAAGKYIGISSWLLRDYVLSGILRPVRLPGSRLRKSGRVISDSKSRSMRKIMLDRADLDALIEESKG